MTGLMKPTVAAHLYRHAMLLLVMALALATTGRSTVDAFAIPTAAKPSTAGSALYAWSMPNDRSFGLSTWYNEYNPTARAIVYNDPSPTERFSFVALGSDWPSVGSSSSFNEPKAVTVPAGQRRGLWNPIRRAWRRRTLRRIFSRRS